MGYVAPVANEAAVNYGNRKVDQEPAVARLDRVQEALFPALRDEDERNAYRHEEERLLTGKRKEIEQELYGKGEKLDLQA
ncbi:hypothetical protein [Salibacterium sp. K-3]